jgi:hypothetical protein
MSNANYEAAREEALKQVREKRAKRQAAKANADARRTKRVLGLLKDIERAALLAREEAYRIEPGRLEDALFQIKRRDHGRYGR